MPLSKRVSRRRYTRVTRKSVKYVLLEGFFRTPVRYAIENVWKEIAMRHDRPLASNRDRREASKRGGGGEGGGGGSTCTRKPSTVRTTAYVYNHTPRLADLDLDPVYVQNPLCIVFRFFIFTRCCSLLREALRNDTHDPFNTTIVWETVFSPLQFFILP